MARPSRDGSLQAMAACYSSLLGMIDGVDKEKSGLKKTPERAAEALQFFTNGYQQTLDGKTPFYDAIHVYGSHMWMVVCY